VRSKGDSPVKSGVVRGKNRWICRFGSCTGRGQPGRQPAARPAVCKAFGGAQVASQQTPCSRRRKSAAGGAYQAPAAWFDDLGFAIEFDCPGRGLVSYTSSGTWLFANGGEFNPDRRAGAASARPHPLAASPLQRCHGSAAALRLLVSEPVVSVPRLVPTG